MSQTQWAPRPKVKVMRVKTPPGGSLRSVVTLSCGHAARWKGAAPKVGAQVTHIRCIRIKDPSKTQRIQAAFAGRLSRALGRAAHGTLRPD